MFKRNIGAADRLFRLVIGAALIAIVFVGPRSPWGWIGLVPIVTALITWCPLYQLLGVSSCRRSIAGARRR